jgi:hypothetical protein
MTGTPEFAVTWDYRCPFARNAHEHLVEALRGGAPWNVRFVPFSLNQAHVEEGGQDVWDDPEQAPNLLSMQAALVVRDQFPDRFLDVHLAFFTARHDESRDVREPDVIRAVLSDNGVDADAVFQAIDGGEPLDTFRKEHEEAVREHSVFGVPTFIAGGRAVFVRLMDRPQGDTAHAQRTIERVVDLVAGWADLNEFKATSIPR